MTRGQAAFEFLTTYGWAILVALIGIAALAHYGIFNPRTVVGDIYDMGPEFSYGGHFFHERNNKAEFMLVLRNNMAEPVIIQANSREIMCHDCVANEGIWQDCGHLYDKNNNNAGGLGTEPLVDPGEEFRFGCQPGNGLPNTPQFGEIGQRHKVSFRFNYVDEDGFYGHPYEGTITGTVEKAN
ncbi:hypothetical protein GOV07_01285 [Candidatus Woesearchaeota archaeon]|nr:hypothetical protein [Candidatus Woesearchaeota archaeon]